MEPFPAAQIGRPKASELVFVRLRDDSGDWDYNPKVTADVLNSLVEYTVIPSTPTLAVNVGGRRSPMQRRAGEIVREHLVRARARLQPGQRAGLAQADPVAEAFS